MLVNTKINEGIQMQNYIEEIEIDVSDIYIDENDTNSYRDEDTCQRCYNGCNYCLMLNY